MMGDNLNDDYLKDHKDIKNYISFCFIDQNLSESNPQFKQNEKIKEKLKTGAYDIIIKDDANLNLVSLIMHIINGSHFKYINKLHPEPQELYTDILNYILSNNTAPYDSYLLK